MHNNIIYFFITLGIASLISPMTAICADDLIPYAGADIQWRHLNFKKGFGNTLVQKNYPQGNAYLGIKFNEYLGFEGGYESTVAKTYTKTLLGKDDWFGRIVDDSLLFPNDSNAFRTTTKIQGAHINMAFFLPINHCLQLIGSVGAAHLNIRVKNLQFILADINLARPDLIEFKKKKLIPRVTVGLQYMMNNQFGIRATGGWENTARFNNITLTSSNLSPILLPQGLVAKLKNSVSLGLGFFYNFK